MKVIKGIARFLVIILVMIIVFGIFVYFCDFLLYQSFYMKKEDKEITFFIGCVIGLIAAICDSIEVDSL